MCSPSIAELLNTQSSKTMLQLSIIVVRRALKLDSPDGQNPVLGSVDPNRKVPDLYFKVVDTKLQVADLKSEVGS